MIRLPSPVTFLLALIAALLLPLALVSSWTAAVVTDTDEYVETVTPLAKDPDVLTAVRRELKVATIRAIANTPAAGRQTNEIERVIRRITSDERFRKVWAQANRSVHEQVISVLENEQPHVDTSDGVVSIDLQPLVKSLLRDLNRAGLPTPGVAGPIEVDVMKTSDLEQARTGYTALDRAGLWLPVAWVVLAVVLLVTARRRLAALGLLAVGSVVTLLLLAVALALGRGEVIGRSPDEDLVGAVWDTLLSTLWSSLWVAVIAAVGVLLLRIAIGAVLRLRNRSGVAEA